MGGLEYGSDVHLDDMVAEIDLLPLLPRSVLNVEYTDEIRRPAPHETVEELEDEAAKHAELGE